jgi:hypothetical protein
MNLKYAYLLLTLLLALSFVTARAQTTKKAKHKTVKKTQKKPLHARVKPAPKPAAVEQKAEAKSLGDAVANDKTDTTKGGGNPAINNGSLNEEIVVTTAYKPVLADAVKIRINPDLEDKAPFKAPLSYFPIDKRLDQNSDIKQLDAMKRPAERDSNLYNNFLKVGLGNLKTTYGEAYFNTGRDSTSQLGGYLKHFAQTGSLYQQKSGKEQVGVFGKNIGVQNALSGRIDYNYSNNYFYGFAPSPVLQVDKQHFSTLKAEGELAKNYKDVENDFTYALKLSGYLFSNAYQAKESNVTLSGFLNETVNQFYAGISGSLDLSTQQDSLYNYNNSIIRANPYLKFQGESYKIDAGINIADEFGFASSVRVFPAAKLEFEVIPKYVRLFAEVKGDINKSSLLDFYTVNPFLGKDLSIKNSIDQLDLSAGLKGTLAPGWSFKASVFRDKIEDMPLFVSDFNLASGYNRFKVIYDNGTSKVNGIKGELDFKVSESVDIFGRGEFKQYQMATVAQAWNLPTKKFTGGTIIHISNTVNITGTMMLRGSTTDPYEAPGTHAPTNVKSFADISGGFEYKASKRIAIFVNANNLLNTSNQTWFYYPDYGFNIFGGVSFGF